MFGWLRPKSSAVVDLRLDKSTSKQDKALAAFSLWANDLVTRHGFELQTDGSDGCNYTVTLTRNEDDPEWLRCRVEARLYVEEDQRERRVMGGHCELLVDSRYTQDERGPEVSLLKPFTPATIAKAQTALDSLLARVRMWSDTRPNELE